MKNLKINDPFNDINYLDRILMFINIYLVYKLFAIYTGGSWLDRSEFFTDGLYSPNLADMLINELLSACVLISILVGRLRLNSFIFFIMGSVVFFTRAGIVLLLIAILVSPFYPRYWKIACFVFLGVASFLIILLRFDFVLPDFSNLALFYGQYPLIGIGRLMITEAGSFDSAIGIVTLFFRPLGIVTFSADYLMSLNGSLSIERYAGQRLSNFEYIPLFDDSFNAFGTILYPYVLACGWFWGILVFGLSLLIYFLILFTLFNKKSVISMSLFFLISGILFSWSSPFMWIAPFLYKVLSSKRFFVFNK